MRYISEGISRFLLSVFLCLIFLSGCGGGGGGSSKQSNATTEKISISGSVIPPSGVNLSSLQIVSLGETSPITTQGSYTAKVYDEGVTIIAAIPENKEFGLMNVVATLNNPISTNKSIPTLRKVIASYKATENNAPVELNAKTTAVSMVFVSPYFLTNDPQKAEEILSIIENDPKVAYLATVIESVFNEPDPLNHPVLTQALIDAVQSTLNTLSAQTSSSKAISTHVSSTSVLHLPRTSYQTLTTSAPYYADQDYITVKAEQSTSGYEVSIDSKNGGSIDWIAEVMQLDSSQFNSLDDLQTKARNNRTLYQDEQNNILGELSGEAKSFFRYIDIIQLAFDSIADYAFGDALKDRITVLSDKNGIYLIRSYSGAWGKLVDPEEKLFVRAQIPNGLTMHDKSWATNGFLGVCDTMGAFVAFDKLLPDDMHKVFKKGIEQAFKELGPVMGNSNPTLSDLLRVSSHIGTAMLSELTNQYAQQATKNFFVTIARIGKISVSSLIDYSGKASKLGKAADRAFQMLTLATPLETTLVVVGTPFNTIADIEKPSIPINLSAISISSSQINLSWNVSTDNIGVIGYKIYRDGGYLKSITTTSTSDAGLTPLTQYCYTVSAYDAANNESVQSSSVCVATQSIGTAPSAPIVFSATTGDGQVTIDWGTVSGASSYNIYWSTSSGVSKTSYTGKISNALSPYTHTGRTNGTTYHYIVTAVNSYGESAESSQVSAAPSTGDSTLASPWPMFGHDAQHTGRSQYVGVQATDLNLKWTTHVGNFLTNLWYDSDITIGYDGTIYAFDGLSFAYLYAINPISGKAKWSYEVEDLLGSGQMAFGPPTVGKDGTIYIGDEEGYIHAINPSDGSLKWRYHSGGYLNAPMTIGDDGTLYAVNDYVKAISPDGIRIWSYKPQDTWVSDLSPAVGSDGTIYVGVDNNGYGTGGLAALNRDGTLKWRYTFGTSDATSPEVAPAVGPDGTIYIGDYTWEGSILYAINPDGNLKWAKYISYNEFTIVVPSIAADGTVYVTAGGHLYAIESIDGSIKWEGLNINPTLGLRSSTIDKNGTIYIGTSDYLYAINPDGTEKWRLYSNNAAFGPPKIGGDGSLYVPYDGGIKAFSPGGDISEVAPH